MCLTTPLPHVGVLLVNLLSGLALDGGRSWQDWRTMLLENLGLQLQM